MAAAGTQSKPGVLATTRPITLQQPASPAPGLRRQSICDMPPPQKVAWLQSTRNLWAGCPVVVCGAAHNSCSSCCTASLRIMSLSFSLIGCPTHTIMPLPANLPLGVQLCLCPVPRVPCRQAHTTHRSNGVAELHMADW